MRYIVTLVHYIFSSSVENQSVRGELYLKENSPTFPPQPKLCPLFSLWSDYLGGSLQFFERDHVFYLQDIVKESVYVLFLTVSQYLAILDTHEALVQGATIQEMVLLSKTVPSLAILL